MAPLRYFTQPALSDIDNITLRETEKDCEYTGCSILCEQAIRMENLASFTKSAAHIYYYKDWVLSDKASYLPNDKLIDPDDIQKQLTVIANKPSKAYCLHVDVLLDEELIGRIHISEACAFATLLNIEWDGRPHTPVSDWQMVGNIRFSHGSKIRFQNHVRMLTQRLLKRLKRCRDCNQLQLDGHISDG